MKTQLIKLAKLKNNTGQIDGLPKNPRFLRDDKFEKLKKSLTDDPEMMEAINNRLKVLNEKP